MIIGKRDREHVERLERHVSFFRTGTIVLETFIADIPTDSHWEDLWAVLDNIQKTVQVMLEKTSA